MTALTQDLLSRFQRLVYEMSDLHFSPRKLVFFERHLRERARERGLADFESYYGFIRDNPDELERLVQGLTTNQTSFFRNPAHFRALRETVLPEIISSRNREVINSWGRPDAAWGPGKRHPAMRIRLWSSGCSTGEEAYSIAFMLLEALKYPKAWDAEVLGTDIKKEALSAARRGIYDHRSTKDMEPAIAGKYMQEAGGSWAVKEEVARYVRFREANIKELSGRRPRRLTLRAEGGDESVIEAEGYFDVIFCRNVMIYFDREGQQRLVNALFECLRPGGYLFTGDSEPLHLFKHGFERAVAGDALFYKRPD